MLQFITTPHRTYFGKDKTKIKALPKRYQNTELSIINNSVVDETKLRLSKQERFNIEYQLFLNDLKINDPFVYEIVHKLELYQVLDVKSKFSENRYELRYQNSYCIKIPKRLFVLYPDKANKFSNY